MKTPLVSLRRVSVSYDGHDALKEVDLDIYPDDFLVSSTGNAMLHG